MASTEIGKITADERGYMTKRAARHSIRKALGSIGLTCGLFSREGDLYSALLTDSEVGVSAKRETGAAITLDCGKRKLTSLTKAAAKAAAAREQERAEVKAEREVAQVAEQLGVDESTARDAIEANADLAPDTLEGFAALGLDEQGELLSRHPRDGGMSAGSIRAMMEADGYDVPPKMRKSDIVDMLIAIVSAEGPVAAPVEAKPARKSKKSRKTQVIDLNSVAADLDVQF